MGHFDERPAAPLLGSAGTLVGGGSPNERHSCLVPDMPTNQTSFSATMSVVQVLRTQRCARIWTGGEAVSTRVGQTRWRRGGEGASPALSVPHSDGGTDPPSLPLPAPPPGQVAQSPDGFLDLGAVAVCSSEEREGRIWAPPSVSGRGALEILVPSPDHSREQVSEPRPGSGV